MSDYVSSSYYIIVPANVRYDKNLTPNAKLLFGEIAGIINEKGICTATNEYFAQLYNLSKDRVSKLINELKIHGYIEVNMITEQNNKRIVCREIKIN